MLMNTDCIIRSPETQEFIFFYLVEARAFQRNLIESPARNFAAAVFMSTLLWQVVRLVTLLHNHTMLRGSLCNSGRLVMKSCEASSNILLNAVRCPLTPKLKYSVILHKI